MIVAIDGPAASGKSTVARELAARLNFMYIDTGAMYRALTWRALRSDIDVEHDATALTRLAEMSNITLGGDAASGYTVSIDGMDVTEAIREQPVTANVSAVSKVPGVRAALVRKQRKYAEQFPNIVLEGRDIGTVVFPQAELKVYLVASTAERARRRHSELNGKGYNVELDFIERDLIRRDTIDSSRKASPLAKAPDAIEIDTTDKTIKQVVKEIISLAKGLM